jgi:hypothetical protein
MSLSRITSSLFFALTFLLLPAVSFAQGNIFASVALNPVSGLPGANTVGDFNGDGIPDQAVTITSTNSVSILIGTGDGNFQPPVNYSVGTYPIAIVTADFNHDGHLDLAVLNNNPNGGGAGGSISILTGKGDGTFVAGATIPVGYEPTALATSDFDGDGNPDLAVVVSNPNIFFTPGSVSIVLGNGSGAFAAHANFGVGVAPTSIAVGDFTGDGKIDLAVGSPVISLSNLQSEVSILVNTGSGNFSPGSSFALSQAGSIPTSIAAADFNTDGKLDLAVALNNTNGFLVFQGAGDGTFTGAGQTTGSGGGSPTWLAAGDLNGDGKADLVVAYSDSTVGVYLGNGDETFANETAYSTGVHPLTLALADLNADGKLDVSVVNNGTNASGSDSNVQVFLGEGNGKLRTFVYHVSSGGNAIKTADFNNDGVPDLAILNADKTVSILLGDGSGGFRGLAPFVACDTSELSSLLAAGDYDGNGKVDLATTCINTSDTRLSATRLYKGAGDGTFVSAGFFQTGSEPDGVALADVDHDGLANLLVLSGAELVTLSDANTTFTDILDQSSEGLAVADFDGDGNLDAVIGQPNLGPATLLGDGKGSFVPHPATSLNATPLLTGDFNGDGLPDVLFQDGSIFALASQLSNGDGTLRDGFRFPCCQSGSNVGDFNGDGILDILGIDNQGIGLDDVFLGQIDGSFKKANQPIPTTLDRRLTAVADFDGNGSQDVAILNRPNGTVTILLNRASFKPTATILSQSPTSAALGQPVTLSAQVSSKSGVPTGTVTFKQSGKVIAPSTLSAGVATTSITAPTTIGQFGYTALYTGDGAYSGSLSQRLLINVHAASTTTVISTSKQNSNLGQSITLTATIKPQYFGTPTGTVKFFADGQPIGSATTAGGQATLNISSLPLGSHKIEADYSGDTGFTSSLGLFTQKVGKASSTVTLASSLNPAVYGQPVTLTATVSDSDGVAPTGLVVFSEGGSIYGSVPPNGSGVAQVTLPQLLVGKHVITAQYSGDASDNSSKANFTETIQGAPTTTAVTTNLNPSNYGQTIAFTATVTATSGSGVPDGTVSFKNGSAVLGTATLTAGQAQLSVNTIDPGAKTIKAVYNGSTTFLTSQDSVQQVVVAAPTTVTLASSLNPSPAGQSVTITATVTCASASPAGTVTFKDGKTVINTANVIGGQAQLTTTTLATGKHSLTAAFAGTKDFAKSTSATLRQVIQ